VDSRKTGVAANVLRTRDLVERVTPMLSHANEHCVVVVGNTRSELKGFEDMNVWTLQG